ncbi:MAG: tetratricopeptide repeat protein [Candidatus Protistobacter heckmanni]|nr:tetratricopeptide repeat protein [Candidatus Protistobacter heckmanni]
MAFDLEEQDKLDNLKGWWQEYGNRVTWALIVVLAAAAAWNGWQWWQGRQAAEAAVLYDEVDKAVQARDAAKAGRAAGDMETKFGGTPYAQMAGLAAARVMAEAKDRKGAIAQLRWVNEHAVSPEFKHIAALRLSALLIDDQQPEEALKALSGEKDAPAAFASLYAERRGDVLLAQNKMAEARDAYRKALEKTEAGAQRQLLEFKLDMTGGA